MNKSKTALSKARSYKEIGEFWDVHDLTDFWGRTRSARFEVDIQSEVTYYALDTRLSEKIRSIAKKRGVSADTLLNLWVQEKLREQKV
jgi:hypothetical protein